MYRNDMAVLIDPWPLSFFHTDLVAESIPAEFSFTYRALQGHFFVVAMQDQPVTLSRTSADIDFLTGFKIKWCKDRYFFLHNLPRSIDYLLSTFVIIQFSYFLKILNCEMNPLITRYKRSGPNRTFSMVEIRK